MSDMVLTIWLSSTIAMWWLVCDGSGFLSDREYSRECAVDMFPLLCGLSKKIKMVPIPTLSSCAVMLDAFDGDHASGASDEVATCILSLCTGHWVKLVSFWSVCW
jgi:hypothetical protein